MKRVDCNKNVLLHQGDSFAMKLTLKGCELQEDDRVVWGVMDAAGGELFRQVAVVRDGFALLMLSNEQTKQFPAGTHKWQARLAANLSDDALWGAVDTLFGVRDFIVKEVAVHV